MKRRGATIALSDVRQDWNIQVSFRRRKRSWLCRLLDWFLGRDY